MRNKCIPNKQNHTNRNDKMTYLIIDVVDVEYMVIANHVVDNVLVQIN